MSKLRRGELNGGSDVSLLSKLGRSVKKRLIPALTGFATGGLGGAVAAVVGAGRPRGGGGAAPPIAVLPRGQPMSMMAGLPVIARAGRAVLPQLQRVIPGAGRVGAAAGGLVRGARALAGNKWSKRAIAAAGYYQIGQLVYDTAGNLVGQVGRRRMNPLNHRALRRAISRVKSARKICRTVEKLSGGGRRRAAPCPPKKCR